jgi:hypothetical protein
MMLLATSEDRSCPGMMWYSSTCGHCCHDNRLVPYHCSFLLCLFVRHGGLACIDLQERNVAEVW